MSKVSIQGNSLGTGTLTIAAPNTNTDRTLTLPDQTGTILTGSGPYSAVSTAPVSAVYVDASGNVGIGTSSPATQLHIKNDSTPPAIRLQTDSVGSAFGVNWYYTSSATNKGSLTLNLGTGEMRMAVGESGNTYFQTFYTNGTERARITSGGDLLVGITSDTASTGAKLLVVGGGSVGNCQAAFGGVNGTSARVFHADNGGSNAASTVFKVEKVNSNSRSINAAGTVNASGADYAEYMTKANDFTIAKGDICGIDSNGKLTNVFADAISFVVKSTDPSYVGGDSWGAGFDDNPTELEIARQKVDRIAFAGQVPVNVIGAIAGQYIVPVNDNGAIKGQAISNPTFEQYQIAVGKVIAIESDGRARIIVKVA